MGDYCIKNVILFFFRKLKQLGSTFSYFRNILQNETTMDLRFARLHCIYMRKNIPNSSKLKLKSC